MPKTDDIIIIGAGLSGLGCAKRLFENGKKFRIISEDIGGRVKTSPDGEVNYGAYYMTADYKNLMPYLIKVGKLRLNNAHFHKGDDHYHVYSPRFIKHIPALLRLWSDLRVFRRRLIKIRDNSLDHSRKELIEGDPLAKKYYHQKASVYIKKRRLEPFVSEYLEQFLWASFFTNPRKVSTAYFLGSLMPLIVPTYTFKLPFEKIIKPFKSRIIKDSVKKIIRKKDIFVLKTKSGKTYSCKKLVVATPMKITNKLLKPQKIKGGINVSFYHLKGEIKELYDRKGYNFFSVKEASAISKEADGTYLYFFSGKDQIKKYFKKWKVITKMEWKPCLYFIGDQYVNLNPAKNLFLANDHNVPSMEDAFINGHYTAKLVMDQ